MYIKIYIERERYIYIYIYICTYAHICKFTVRCHKLNEDSLPAQASSDRQLERIELWRQDHHLRRLRRAVCPRPPHTMYRTKCF